MCFTSPYHSRPNWPLVNSCTGKIHNCCGVCMLLWACTLNTWSSCDRYSYIVDDSLYQWIPECRSIFQCIVIAPRILKTTVDSFTRDLWRLSSEWGRKQIEMENTTDSTGTKSDHGRHWPSKDVLYPHFNVFSILYVLLVSGVLFYNGNKLFMLGNQATCWFTQHQLRTPGRECIQVVIRFSTLIPFFRISGDTHNSEVPGGILKCKTPCQALWMETWGTERTLSILFAPYSTLPIHWKSEQCSKIWSRWPTYWLEILKVDFTSTSKVHSPECRYWIFAWPINEFKSVGYFRHASPYRQ